MVQQLSDRRLYILTDRNYPSTLRGGHLRTYKNLSAAQLLSLAVRSGTSVPLSPRYFPYPLERGGVTSTIV